MGDGWRAVPLPYIRGRALGAMVTQHSTAHRDRGTGGQGDRGTGGKGAVDPWAASAPSVRPRAVRDSTGYPARDRGRGNNAAPCRDAMPGP